jgi:hypothetical protein
MGGFPGILQSFLASNLDTQGIQTFPPMVILIAETRVDYVFYFKTFDEGALKVYAELPKNISSEKEIDLYEKGIILENEIVEAKADKLYIAPWGDMLKIEEVKEYQKVSDRPFYNEMSDEEKAEIRKYSEDMRLPYEFIKFSRFSLSN